MPQQGICFQGEVEKKFSSSGLGKLSYPELPYSDTLTSYNTFLNFYQIHLTVIVSKNYWIMQNTVDPDQMLHSAASDLGLHCFSDLSV